MSQSIFFAFPDGLVCYDCQQCSDKACCHDSGINFSLQGRGEELLRHHPELQLEIMPQTGNMLYAPFLPSGCRFCREGRCSLREAAYYPDYCRLYPFTLMALLGDTLILAPDPRCHWQIQTNGNGVKYAELAELLEKLEPCAIPVAPNCQPEDLPREILIRDTVADCLHNDDTIWSLLAFCQIVDNYQGELEKLDISKAMADFITEFQPRLESWLRLIGLGNVAEEPLPALAQLLMANIPAQRIFGGWTDRATFAMAYAGLAAYLFRLPKELQKRTGPLDICQYLSSLEPLLWHLTHWRDKPFWPEKEPFPERWPQLKTVEHWGEYLFTIQKSLAASTIVELRLLYEDLREQLKWK